MRVHATLCSPLICLKILRMHYITGQREYVIKHVHGLIVSYNKLSSLLGNKLVIHKKKSIQFVRLETNLLPRDRLYCLKIDFPSHKLWKWTDSFIEQPIQFVRLEINFVILRCFMHVLKIDLLARIELVLLLLSQKLAREINFVIRNRICQLQIEILSILANMHMCCNKEKTQDAKADITHSLKLIFYRNYIIIGKILVCVYLHSLLSTHELQSKQDLSHRTTQPIQSSSPLLGTPMGSFQ